jgi:chromosome partitioning protein
MPAHSQERGLSVCRSAGIVVLRTARESLKDNMRFKETQIITFANQKGGCGKTSSAVSVAAAFSEAGYSVCLLDTDSQCNSSDTLGIDTDEHIRAGNFTLADIYLNRVPASEVEVHFGDRFRGLLTLIPGNRALRSVAARLETEKLAALATDEHSILDTDDIAREQRQRLKESLKTLRGKHDVVIIDTPPDLGFEMTTALIASDWIIIPVFPSGYDLRGLETLVRTMEKVRKRYNPTLRQDREARQGHPPSARREVRRRAGVSNHHPAKRQA